MEDHAQFKEIWSADGGRKLPEESDLEGTQEEVHTVGSLKKLVYITNDINEKGYHLCMSYAYQSVNAKSWHWNSMRTVTGAGAVVWEAACGPVFLAVRCSKVPVKMARSRRLKEDQKEVMVRFIWDILIMKIFTSSTQPRQF